MRHLLRPLLLPMILVGATGCSGIELESRPPPGFDLSGHWQLIEDDSETTPSHRHLRARGGMIGFVTQDFPVLRARTMDIEQSRDSMGIRYDGSEYRDVSWGIRQRGLWEVRTGWNEGQLVIISDADDAEAREVMTLSENSQRLSVDVRIDSGGEDLDITRVFERSAALTR